LRRKKKLKRKGRGRWAVVSSFIGFVRLLFFKKDMEVANKVFLEKKKDRSS